jgi:hypothetical protein
MFPDRINRLIVDGVVDAYDYEKSLWFDNLSDTEKDLNLFYYHCARVGFPTCALANETGTTSETDVKERTEKILQSLYHHPFPVIDRDYPNVITYTDVKGLILGVLYSPIGGFEYLAEFLSGLEKGDIGQFAERLQLHQTLSGKSELYGDLSLSFQGLPTTSLSQGDATMGIACTDGADQTWLTREGFREHIANLTKLSPSVGEVWSMVRLQCIHYHVRPVHRFKGPWIAKTSHPILEIGNTADPVTPGRYAKKMAKGFEGAVALIQDSPGHCSLAAPSNCTIGYVQRYFQTGEF